MSLIVHVDSETGFSGGEVQVFLLMESLAKSGFENVLVCPAGSRAFEEAAARSIPTFEVRLRNDLDLMSVLRLASWLRKSGADLVHLHTGRATWLGGLAAKLAGIPAITTRRMDRDVSRGFRTRLIYGSLVRRAIAISDGVRGCLLAGGVPDEMIRVISSVVDPSKLEPQGEPVNVRRELGIGEDEFLLLTMAALVPRKALDVLIDAVAALDNRAVKFRTLIAGDGPERAALEEQVERLGIQAQVSFLGFRSDKVDLLGAADAFVLPSHREGLGVAALEAMAAGKAVVASRVGGLAEVVDDGRTGFLVEAGDADLLAEAIGRVATDAPLCAELGRRGRERLLSHFSVEAQAEQYIETYAQVLAGS